MRKWGDLMGFRIENPMPPPWLMYPQLSRCCIGWRMGYGEEYRFEFGDWLESLSQEEQREYELLFPQPLTWRGYYGEGDGEEEEDLCYSNGHHFLAFWRAGGKPAYGLQELKSDFSKGKRLNYLFFWGHQPSADGSVTKTCLSQWWQADFQIDAERYSCMEQYMMAEKARLFGDREAEEKIMAGGHPKQIKALGRTVKGFSEEEWDAVKYSVVLNGNYQKFLQNPNLLEFLLSTGGRILVEASPYDGVWGIRGAAGEPGIENPLTWRGENLLGFALMEVRGELRRVCQNRALADWKQVKEKYE